MSSNNYNNGFNKYYGTSDTYKRPSSFKDFVEQPIRCRQCNKLIIGEYNFDTRKVTTYEFDNYPNQRIEHEHQADTVTTTDVMHRTAVEIRLLYAPDPDDYHYVMEGRVN